jgi:hypothetical protein
VISHPKGRTYIESVSEQSAEKNILSSRNEETRGFRKLHNSGRFNLYSSLNSGVFNSKRINWMRYTAPVREMRNAYKILVGK